MGAARAGQAAAHFKVARHHQHDPAIERAPLWRGVIGHRLEFAVAHRRHAPGVDALHREHAHDARRTRG